MSMPLLADPGFDERALQAVAALGETLMRVLSITRLLIETGRPVDVAELDRVIGLFCAKSLDLPPELGRTLRPRLHRLLQEIDAIILTLRRHAGIR